MLGTRQQRDGTEDDDDAVDLELVLLRAPLLARRIDPATLQRAAPNPEPEMDVPEPLAGEVAVVPEAPVGRHGVRAGIAHDALLVEPQETVADPGCLEGGGVVRREREDALAHH